MLGKYLQKTAILETTEEMAPSQTSLCMNEGKLLHQPGHKHFK